MKHLQIIDGVVRFSFGSAPDKNYWTDIVEVDDEDSRYLEFIAENVFDTGKQQPLPSPHSSEQTQ